MERLNEQNNIVIALLHDPNRDMEEFIKEVYQLVGAVEAITQNK